MMNLVLCLESTTHLKMFVLKCACRVLFCACEARVMNLPAKVDSGVLVICLRRSHDTPQNMHFNWKTKKPFTEPRQSNHLHPV